MAMTQAQAAEAGACSWQGQIALMPERKVKLVKRR
jgi:hypothetical protein